MAAVPERAAGGSSSINSPLAAALEAVNTLALALTEAEADAANEQAVRALVPVLRAASSCSDKVEVVRDGIKLLHAAAVKGELAEAGLQQKVQEALRCLVGRSAVAEAGKRKAPESSSEFQWRQGIVHPSPLTKFRVRSAVSLRVQI